jgi:hypothetical protein
VCFGGSNQRLSVLLNFILNLGFLESGFAHLDRATRTLCGAGMDSRIGVVHARMLGTFQTAGGRREAAKAAVSKQQRAKGSSSNGMALGQVDVDAKEAEFEITRSLELPQGKALGYHSASPASLPRRRRRSKPRSTSGRGRRPAGAAAAKETRPHSPVRRAVRQVQWIYQDQVLPQRSGLKSPAQRLREMRKRRRGAARPDPVARPRL